MAWPSTGSNSTSTARRFMVLMAAVDFVCSCVDPSSWEIFFLSEILAWFGKTVVPPKTRDSTGRRQELY